MTKKFLLLIGLLFISSIILGFVLGKEISSAVLEKNSVKPADQTSLSSPEDDKQATSKTIDPIKSQLEELTLEEKIGQLVMVGVDGYDNDANSKELIEKYHVGGFVLLKQNVKDAEQLLTLINSLKETNTANKIPLFLAIDEEGGRISRMPGDLKKLPSSGEIGKHKDAELSYRIGSVLGEELKSFGLNMNFAPVLDINSNPKNPVIGDRAFGSTPELVTELGIETMKGIRSQNIISVVKHFPGHGDTSVDSHLDLPKVESTLERLESFELTPFKAAIENQVDVIMLAHILLPKIDSENPASLSKAVITEILREKMGFNGVVITDDLTMGAIAENYDLGKAAVKSLKAGSDIILVCHDYEKEVRVLEGLQTAVKAGEISEDRIDESVYRILSLKAKYALSNEPVYSIDLEGINQKIDQLYKDYAL